MLVSFHFASVLFSLPGLPLLGGLKRGKSKNETRDRHGRPDRLPDPLIGRCYTSIGRAGVILSNITGQQCECQGPGLAPKGGPKKTQESLLTGPLEDGIGNAIMRLKLRLLLCPSPCLWFLGVGEGEER